MRATAEEQIVVVLELTELEASWLRGVMQNPLHGQEPGMENPDESELREAMFEALAEALED